MDVWLLWLMLELGLLQQQPEEQVLEFVEELLGDGMAVELDQERIDQTYIVPYNKHQNLKIFHKVLQV